MDFTNQERECFTKRRILENDREVVEKLKTECSVLVEFERLVKFSFQYFIGFNENKVVEEYLERFLSISNLNE